MAAGELQREFPASIMNPRQGRHAAFFCFFSFCERKEESEGPKPGKGRHAAFFCFFSFS